MVRREDGSPRPRASWLGREAGAQGEGVGRAAPVSSEMRSRSAHRLPGAPGREGLSKGCCPRPARWVLKHASASHSLTASCQEKGSLAFKNGGTPHMGIHENLPGDFLWGELGTERGN